MTLGYARREKYKYKFDQFHLSQDVLDENDEKKSASSIFSHGTSVLGGYKIFVHLACHFFSLAPSEKL